MAGQGPRCMAGPWPGPGWPRVVPRGASRCLAALGLALAGPWPGPWLALGLALAGPWPGPGWPLAWPLAGPWPGPWLALGLALAGPWPGPGWPWLAREHPKDHQSTTPSAGGRSLQNGSYISPYKEPIADSLQEFTSELPQLATN